MSAPDDSNNSELITVNRAALMELCDLSTGTTCLPERNKQSEARNEACATCIVLDVVPHMRIGSPQHVDCTRTGGLARRLVVQCIALGCPCGGSTKLCAIGSLVLCWPVYCVRESHLTTRVRTRCAQVARHTFGSFT